MKRTIFSHFITIAFLFWAVSCDLLSDMTASSKLTFKTGAFNKTSLSDSVLFSGKNIKSYNTKTGEVVFNDSIPIHAFRSNWTIKCQLNADSLFVFRVTSDIMSSIYNDLVLNHNLYENKYYFEDGYPGWIDNVGDGTIRAQNKEKRATAWAKFIAQLTLEGKLVE